MKEITQLDVHNTSISKRDLMEKINEIILINNIQTKQIDSLFRTLDTVNNTVSDLNLLIEELERRVTSLRSDVNFIDSEYI